MSANKPSPNAVLYRAIYGEDTPEYHPDCPACLRGHRHTVREHEAGIDRATRYVEPDSDN